MLVNWPPMEVLSICRSTGQHISLGTGRSEFNTRWTCNIQTIPIMTRGDRCVCRNTWFVEPGGTFSFELVSASHSDRTSWAGLSNLVIKHTMSSSASADQISGGGPTKGSPDQAPPRPARRSPPCRPHWPHSRLSCAAAWRLAGAAWWGSPSHPARALTHYLAPLIYGRNAADHWLRTPSAVQHITPTGHRH
jgi:hypothetical protein